MKLSNQILFIATLMFGCKAYVPGSGYKDNTLESVQYDKKTDKTVYTIFPYGNIELPGKWTKGRYSNVSFQQWFKKDLDSTQIAVTKNPPEKYSFYRKGMADYEVAVSFYKWDAEYFEKQGYSIDLVGKSEEKSYVLWRINFKNGGTSTFLYGMKNQRIYNFMIEGTREREAKDTSFLTKIYAAN